MKKGQNGEKCDGFITGETGKAAGAERAKSEPFPRSDLHCLMKRERKLFCYQAGELRKGYNPGALIQKTREEPPAAAHNRQPGRFRTAGNVRKIEVGEREKKVDDNWRCPRAVRRITGFSQENEGNRRLEEGRR